MKKILCIILAVMMMATPVSAGTVLTKTIKTSTKTITVRKGQKIKLKIKGKKAKFTAKKCKTFAITKKGVLTAKKVGTAKLKYKIGKKVKTVKVIVKANKLPTPAVEAPADETGTATRVTTPTPKSTKDDPLVWRTATGKKYHSINNCGTTNPAKARQITRSEAEDAGLTPCSKCYGAAA